MQPGEQKYIFSNLDNYRRYIRSMLGMAIEEGAIRDIHARAEEYISKNYDCSLTRASFLARLSFAGWLVDNRVIISSNPESV